MQIWNNQLFGQFSRFCIRLSSFRQKVMVIFCSLQLAVFRWNVLGLPSASVTPSAYPRGAGSPGRAICYQTRYIAFMDIEAYCLRRRLSHCFGNAIITLHPSLDAKTARQRPAAGIFLAVLPSAAPTAIAITELGHFLRR